MYWGDVGDTRQESPKMPTTTHPLFNSLSFFFSILSNCPSQRMLHSSGFQSGFSKASLEREKKSLFQGTRL